MANGNPVCELCLPGAENVLWRSPACRVIRVADSHYPGFCRVIWSDHVREMTDLDPAARQELMRVVFGVESVVRELFHPDKINLASFGNMVPHVHWHVIPRWRDDRHFPEPIWGGIRRDGRAPPPVVGDEAMAEALHRLLD